MVVPISLYNSYEQATREAVSKILPLQISILGIDVKHWRPRLRVTNDAYGNAAGTPKLENLRFLGSEKILMNNSHWRIIDNNEIGYLDDPGYMYCYFLLEDGDVLSVIRPTDQRQIDFVVQSVEGIGNTTTILNRFRMANVSGS